MVVFGGVYSISLAIRGAINREAIIDSEEGLGKDGVAGNDIDNAADAMSPDSSSKLSEPSGITYYTVVHVRDGDTIDVIYDGEKTGVRLIGVDTPETVHPDEPEGCYGKEASDFTVNTLSNQSVGLEFDASQGKWDAHGRLLAFVWFNGKNFNKELIEQGYGYEYTYDKPYKYQSSFMQAELVAKSNQRGLWGKCEEVNGSFADLNNHLYSYR